METLSAEWVVGLGLLVLLLLLAWGRLFPGLTDSAPEKETTAQADPERRVAHLDRFDLPG